MAAPPMNVSLDRSEGSLLSEDALDTEDDALDTGDELDVNIDELDTPDEGDSLEFNRPGGTYSCINVQEEYTQNELAICCLCVHTSHLPSILLSQTVDSEESNLGAGAASTEHRRHRADEEGGDGRLWRTVVIGEQEHRIDMKCIEPYKRVISHGGNWGLEAMSS